MSQQPDLATRIFNNVDAAPGNALAGSDIVGIYNANGEIQKTTVAELAAYFSSHVPCFGETYEFNETGSVLTLTAPSTPYRWITGVTGAVKGAGYVTWDNAAAPTGKRLVVGASGAGTYLVSATFAGNLAKHADLSMDVFKNASAAANITCDFHVTEDGSYVAGSASGLLVLAEGDTVTMWFSASVGTNGFTIKHANVTLLRVG